MNLLMDGFISCTFILGSATTALIASLSLLTIARHDRGSAESAAAAAAGQLMRKTGDIHLAGEQGRCVAYWRPVDGSPDVVLCAADLSTCDRHPHVRELLIELAVEVSLNREREAGDSAALPVRAPLVFPRAPPEPPGARPAA
jgi:hypothetical protein